MYSKLIVNIFIAVFSVPFSLYAQTITDPPKREFRAVWIATVGNIDWPSKPGLSVQEQKSELLYILNTHQRTGMNAIIFQVRPAADAFYGKGKEPWSRFLNGTQGLPPNPYYDPLEFAITEAHKRGMELHAWFNPYRATTDLSEPHVSPQHITKLKPGWFFSYAGKKLFDPGIPEVQEYIIQIILDVVRNYDVDGIHFDDYFYPYPEKNQTIQDQRTYNQYNKQFTNITDWRRQNVDTLMHRLYDSIHSVKKHVKFGISPFGIWRNKSQDPEGSATSGLEGYSQLYGDARKWIRSGWVDYINPQIYFPFNFRTAAYDVLVDWWSMNTFGRHLYIGHASYRTIEKKEGWRDLSQLPNQIRYLRNDPRVQGSVYFSSNSITRNYAGISDSLQYDFYRNPALQPAMIWLDDTPPKAPANLFSGETDNKQIILKWQKPIDENVYGYVIYRFNKGEEINIANSRNILKISFENNNTSFIDTTVRSNVRYTYIMTAIDRLKNESVPSNQAVIELNN